MLATNMHTDMVADLEVASNGARQGRFFAVVAAEEPRPGEEAGAAVVV